MKTIIFENIQELDSWLKEFVKEHNFMPRITARFFKHDVIYIVNY